jgi:antitoxin YefM
MWLADQQEVTGTIHGTMTTITASEARKNLFPLIKQVNDDRAAIHISSRGGTAVLVSEAEWNSLQETSYLLRNPFNAQRLVESMEQFRRGDAKGHQLVDTSDGEHDEHGENVD